MNGTRVLGLAAAGAFLVLAAPIQTAQAASLINPGAAAAVQRNVKDELATEVRWHWHRWHHHRWHWRRWRHW